ncbi:MAG: ABC transporter permease [Bacteroidales bacterium]|nr:ABC transporter permease [Bacteroidales bacterium]
MSQLSFHWQLARRILRDKGDKFSKPIIRLSVFGVSLGVVIMLIAIGVTAGYKQVIEDKVVAMGQHIRISHYDRNYSYEQTPIMLNDTLLHDVFSHPEVVSMQPYATKVGIIKTADQVEGVVLKGVDKSFNGREFARNMLEGDTLQLNDSVADSRIILSKRLADKLQIKVGDKVRTYFVQDPPRQRSFTLSGIYETGLPEYDTKFALVDLRHVQKLNDWDSAQVSGVEVLTRDYSMMDEVGEQLHHQIDINLKAETVKQIYPEIFDWIALFDTNVSVLLIITTCVCMITMMSIFFIIILENTKLIGILKTLGMKTKHVVQTFLIVAGGTLLKGLLIGNVIGLGFGLLQQRFHFIKLNPDTYYVNFVPIKFEFWQVLLLNFGVFAACMLVLVVPAWVISRKISPVKAVQFE